MPMKGIMFVGLFVLAAYAVAFVLDRIIPMRPSRRSRLR